MKTDLVYSPNVWCFISHKTTPHSWNLHCTCPQVSIAIRDSYYTQKTQCLQAVIRCVLMICHLIKAISLRSLLVYSRQFICMPHRWGLSFLGLWIKLASGSFSMAVITVEHIGRVYYLSSFNWDVSLSALSAAWNYLIACFYKIRSFFLS